MYYHQQTTLSTSFTVQYIQTQLQLVTNSEEGKYRHLLQHKAIFLTAAMADKAKEHH
jgi:hypothetical protein